MMPASASNPRSSVHAVCCIAISAAARTCNSPNCCAGVRPSAESEVTPALACPISPATRTEKNSSRLDALIETKRSRSSSG